MSTKAPYVFVCYAHDEAARVYPHVEWLQEHGVDCWYDRHIRVGTIWMEEIGQALARATHLLFFVSRASIASDHCSREVAFAIDHAKDVIPVFLEDVALTPGLEVSLSRVQALMAHRLQPDEVHAKLLAAITGDGARGEAESSAPIRIVDAPPRKRMYWGIAAVAAVAVAVAIVALAWWRGLIPVGSGPNQIADASVAVLPFVAMTDDATTRHLGDAFADEITNQLAGRPDLKVASRTSAFQAGGGDITAIGRSLGVAYVVEGSVRPQGDGIRLTAQLVRAGDGFHVWSETYDLPAATTSIAQQDALRTVSMMVDAHLDEEVDLQRSRSETTSDEAYSRYASARRLRNQLEAGGTAVPMFGQRILDDVDAALALDPEFVSALNLRANTYLNRVDGTTPWEVVGREARKSIDRALELTPNNSRSLIQLAAIQMSLELDPGAAQQTLDRIRQIDPHQRKLNEQFARLAMMRGRAREAMQYWEQQIDANPYEATAHFQYGLILLQQQDTDGAEREFDAVLRLSPKGQFFVGGTVGLIQMWVQRGDIDKAKAVFEPLWTQLQHARPTFLAFPLALLGRESEARALIEDASREPGVDPTLVALTYCSLKAYADALVWLRRGIDDRNGFVLVNVRMPNAFLGLQELPGYAELLAHLDSLQRSQ